MVSTVVPHICRLRGVDILRYLSRVAEAIITPLLVQDFNRGGPTFGPVETLQLNRQYPNFKYARQGIIRSGAVHGR
ncbi:MAG: hypothetical protein EXR57_02715 [Dehalococcoidia bacterium]|nr:hypothetical protein [Dehalococcoidia bacterium]